MPAIAIVISPPFTSDQLKSAYRLAVKQTHPDKGGSPADFRAVQDEYERLLPLCSNQSNNEISTMDARLLSELGLGLGPTKNGKTCSECSGNGYHSSKVGGIREDCPNTVHFNRTVDLWTDFLFIPRRRNGPKCAICFDNGYILRKQKIVFTTCFTCKGMGEVEVFNPAFPKGLISAK